MSMPVSAADIDTKSPKNVGICPHNIVNGRNLIVCIDGTSNQFGEKNTNVIELYNRIIKDDEQSQRTWYNSGIGTYARPSWKSLSYYKRVFDNKIDLAIAWNFEETILAAYRWLSENYKKDDCIFLFGFSRGAYQVRALSAMIEKVGLIYKGNEAQIPFAYELYADARSGDKQVEDIGAKASSDSDVVSMAERFKGAFSRKDVKVHFVGAWDTVSSVGVLRDNYMLPGTIDGMHHVCYFRHALALDERRVKFLPEYAYGGSTLRPVHLKDDVPKPTLIQNKVSTIAKAPLSTVPKTTEKNETLEINAHNGLVTYQGPEDWTAANPSLKNRSTWQPQTKEVWFPGTHSDIGGGNTINKSMDLGRPPLRWMVQEAGAVGLHTVPFGRDPPETEQVEVQESLTWFWMFLEVLPFRRLTFTRRDDGTHLLTYKPHLGKSRKIHPGQKVHSSLLLEKRKGEAYVPKARPVSGGVSFWTELRKKGFESEWLELDFNDQIDEILDASTNGSSPGELDLGILRRMAVFAAGWQAVYDQVIKALERNSQHRREEIKYHLLHASMEVLKEAYKVELQAKLRQPNDVYPLLSDLLVSKNNVHRRIAVEFWTLFTDPCAYQVDFLDTILSVAFSADGSFIYTNTIDNVLHTSHANTGINDSRTRNPYFNEDALFLSADGKLSACCSKDNSIWVWETGKTQASGKLLTGPKGPTKSIAFSRDAKHLASVAYDGVRVWNLGSGGPGRVLSNWYTNALSIAFSPDSKRVVVGFGDGAVRIWDLEGPQKDDGRLLGLHAGRVWAVVFSSDNRHVASSSSDYGIWIWDTQLWKVVWKLRGHTDDVLCVAFSPDGKSLVSGSMDGTVRLWDMERGLAVGPPMKTRQGNDIAAVHIVSFSPDGSKVLSASADYLIALWDVSILNQEPTTAFLS